jgi:predicted small lipoprotein YifL
MRLVALGIATLCLLASGCGAYGPPVRPADAAAAAEATAAEEEPDEPDTDGPKTP